jgi:hypothetical protein
MIAAELKNIHRRSELALLIRWHYYQKRNIEQAFKWHTVENILEIVSAHT